MSKHDATVVVFDTHTEAEAAVKKLQHSGFDMSQLSIIGKDFHTEEHVVGYYNSGERMSYWGKLGVFWGGMWGLLMGSAFFFIPGVGPLVMAGPIVASIVGGLEGAAVVGGLSVLGAALYSLGIPKDSIMEYETAVKSNKFVLVIHGSADELESAKAILANTDSAAYALSI